MQMTHKNIDNAFKGFRKLFDQAFENATSHKDTVAMTVPSLSSEEVYAWLGQFPELREWIGDRQINQIAAHGFTIKNKLYESTVTVKRTDFEDDRLGLYKPLIQEAGRASRTHPDKMIFSMLKQGFDTMCFDGQNFFDTDHPSHLIEGGSHETVSISNMQVGSGKSWYLIDASRAIKPVIWQERVPYDFQSITGDQDAHVFLRDEFLYGIRARVNCGFGLWQLAFGSKAELTTENYSEARSAMMAFPGDAGQLLGVSPTHLIVPPSLEKEARALIFADQVEGTSNVWKDSVELVVTPYVA
ncbi:MAG: Mu-like prophage major head subunit gpT family protein [Pseudomonadota bacterium]